MILDKKLRPKTLHKLHQEHEYINKNAKRCLNYAMRFQDFLGTVWVPNTNSRRFACCLWLRNVQGCLRMLLEWNLRLESTLKLVFSVWVFCEKFQYANGSWGAACSLLSLGFSSSTCMEQFRLRKLYKILWIHCFKIWFA